ncbi:PhzF family phenazine biosynthesis protein [Streptomyces sp. NBC_00091]|uniref:PhzF family phenazine biosynthesis protein n=1 Tax=Streptomyces sp. NBC_00091 TaxID=2975648 RepID=UPI0022522E76|nr:PhzF family phenazine biosynthesis protein [Streptomyces sp. NBC_00091]MCX5380563.1 PhzF family phenazine biosynthesis protein [Streptomyces sp. NBC_00091]
MRYHHVDVFARRPYSGNSLAVFPDAEALTTAQMRAITRELRHFESVFLVRDPARPYTCRARVFDLAGELDFAGHPLIGAASVLHALHTAGTGDSLTWTLRLGARTVEVTTRRSAPRRYEATLDQGPGVFLGRPGEGEAADIAARFSLDARDLDPALPPETVSTGLRYLVLPVRGDALARARITAPLDAPLGRLGAGFAYLLDATAREGRHWTNDGLLEDVATGSGAGCAAAYLRRHGRIGDGEPVVLHQGRFTGRPSEMTVSAHGHGQDIRRVEVGGAVALLGEGVLAELP